MKVNYPISVNYMSHWSETEAIRELLQNAIDSGSYNLIHTQSGITLTNTITSGLDLDSLLLLGESSKANDDSTIGKFGEGLKLALLVLARDGTDHQIVVTNADDTKFKLRGLIVDNRFVMHYTGKLTQPVTMSITIDSPTAMDNCNKLLVPGAYKVLNTVNGSKIMSPGRKLYVNGLFVCNTSMSYSYDLTPELLKLDRDRSSVSTFDLTWEIAKLWAKTDDVDLLVESTYKQLPDFEYLHHYADRKLLDAIREHFLANYGPKAVVAESAERAKAYEQFFDKVVCIGGSYGRMVMGHAEYKKTVPSAPRIKPSTAVEKFVTENMKHMRSKAKRAAKELHLTSIHW